MDVEQQEVMADSQPPHHQLEQEMLTDDVIVNSNETETEPILTSLHISGVDDLSTAQLKKYIDLHIKPEYSFVTRKKYSYLEYRLKWINDSEVNVIFDYNLNKKEKYPSNRIKNNMNRIDLMDELENIQTSNDDIKDGDDDTLLEGFQNESIKGAAESIILLTDFENIRREHEEFSQLTTQEQFQAVEQAPKLEDRKCWDLILNGNNEVIRSNEARKLYDEFKNNNNNNNKYNNNSNDNNNNEHNEQVDNQESLLPPSNDYKIIKLEVRYSTPLDKKIHNSKAYSKYYLIHGEPDQTERGPRARENLNGKELIFENDLITGEKPETHGLFGYDGDLDETSVTDRSYRERDGGRTRGRGRGRGRGNWGRGRGKSRSMGNGRWETDKFFSSQHRPRGGVNKQNTHPRRNRPDPRVLEGDLFPDFFNKNQ